jgi:hypothetical protein
MKNLNKVLIGFAVAVAIIVPSGIVINYYNTPGEYDEFAACLEENGAQFYGAFWCPHCQNQKAAFGKSSKYLPYTECSTPDGKGQMAACTEAGIESYPTWKFADGSMLTGEQSLEVLAAKTGCEVAPAQTENLEVEVETNQE